MHLHTRKGRYQVTNNYVIMQADNERRTDLYRIVPGNESLILAHDLIYIDSFLTWSDAERAVEWHLTRHAHELAWTDKQGQGAS